MNSKKTVCLILSALMQGGVSRMVINLASQLNKNGYTVHILVMNNADSPYVRYLDKNIRVIPLGFSFEELSLHRSLMGHRNFFSAAAALIYTFAAYIVYVPKMIKALARYIKKCNPYCFICNEFEIPVILAKIRLKENFKIAVILHSNYSMSFVNQMHSISWFFLQKLLRLFKHADVVAGVSAGVLNDAAALGIVNPSKSCVLYNPVIGDSFYVKSRLPVTDDWLTHKKVPVFISAGRLAKSKKFDNCIRAFAIVLEKIPARLMILGEGDQRDNLVSLIESLSLKESVRLPGFADNLYSIMGSADVFVLSSSFEGLSLVLIEALACGTTCVSTDCPSGPSEILENGKYGYLVPVDNVEALANGMLTALRNPLDKEILKKRAEFFSYESCYSRYEDMFAKFFDNDLRTETQGEKRYA